MASLVNREKVRLLVLASALLVGYGALGASASAQDTADGAVTVELIEVDGSGVSGVAILTPEGDQIQVDMTLEGPGLVGNHPTHIHTGTCTNFDPNPLYPLETVLLEPVSAEGRSVSTVDVPLEQLQRGDYVILVHLSPEALTTYLVCGEIPEAGAGGETATGETTPAAVGGQAAATPASVGGVPGSGTGVAADRPGTFAVVAALGMVAGVLLTAGLRIRRQGR